MCGASPCAARPAADLLHVCACSGPRVIVRSSSSCPRSHASSGAMGRPHRQHVALPAWTMGDRARRRRWWAVPYPRCAVVPRALSCCLVCSGHRETPGGHGTVHPCSRHGCLARAMVSTSVRVVDGPHGCAAVGAVIPCAHRGGAGGRAVWGCCAGARGESRTHTGIPFEGMASTD